MERQSALRRIAYEVLDIPGIRPGTELAARTPLEAVQAERPDETRVAQYALDLQMCLSGRKRYRDHHARLQKLVNQANQRTTFHARMQSLTALIGASWFKSVLRFVWLSVYWCLGGVTALIMVAVAYVTFLGENVEWQNYSAFSSAMVALCASILLGMVGTLPEKWRVEKRLATIIGTGGLILSAFLLLINVIVVNIDPGASINDIINDLRTLFVFTASAVITITMWIAFYRYKKIYRYKQI